MLETLTHSIWSASGLRVVEIQHAIFLPVRAAARHAVDRELAVLRRREAHEAHGAVFRPLVRIDQHLGLAGQALLDVEHALVLQAVVLREEVVLALARRRRVLRVVVERVQPLGQLRAVRNLVEIRERHLVLRLDPRRGLRGRVVLQPSIRVGDRRAVIGVDVIDGLGGGVLEALGGQGRSTGRATRAR